MDRMFSALVAALLFVALVPAPAAAWGAKGHRLIGALAEQDLTPAARREVARLLAGEPEPTLAGISTWADELRGNDPGLGRRSAPWHYVNLHSPECRYDAARDCDRGDCVVDAIRRQTAILADARRPVAERRQALKFVVHFVGDVHQPLHAGNRDDKGGNAVQVRIPTRGGGDRGGNLHALWDSALIDYTGLEEPAYLARLRAMPLALRWPRRALPPAAADWAMQACRITLRAGFYPAEPRLDADYPTTWTPVVDEQMRRAGARLARLLNAALAR